MLRSHYKILNFQELNSSVCIQTLSTNLLPLGGSSNCLWLSCLLGGGLIFLERWYFIKLSVEELLVQSSVTLVYPF